MSTGTSSEENRKNSIEISWRQLNDLADQAEETSRLGQSLHQDLINKMITAVRKRDIDTLKQLANEDPRFSYTANIRRILEKMLHNF